MGGSFNAGDIRLFSDPLARVNVARSVDFANRYPACHAGGRGFKSCRAPSDPTVGGVRAKFGSRRPN
jgi:hypothetical protein